MKDTITATLKRTWEMLDGSKPIGSRTHKVEVWAGEYELEWIANPYYPNTGSTWLVLKGTKIGMATKAWMQRLNGPHPNNPSTYLEWNDFQIRLVVNGCELDSSCEELFDKPEGLTPAHSS